MDVSSFLISDPKAAKLIEPTKSRSATHRHRPRSLPCPALRLAIKATMCRNGGLVGSQLRHTHGRPSSRWDDDAEGRVLLATAGWSQLEPELAANHFGSRP
jgi:hypothetical protein